MPKRVCNSDGASSVLGSSNQNVNHGSSLFSLGGAGSGAPVHERFLGLAQQNTSPAQIEPNGLADSFCSYPEFDNFFEAGTPPEPNQVGTSSAFYPNSNKRKHVAILGSDDDSDIEPETLAKKRTRLLSTPVIPCSNSSLYDQGRLAANNIVFSEFIREIVTDLLV